MPSVVCPLPTAHSPQDALKAYLNAKKQMPGLTPAAWRKAAAQSMGLDYDTYLALWKVHKGVASRLKMIPESKPTVPAAQSSAPAMGMKVPATPASNFKILDEATDQMDKQVALYEKGLMTTDELHKYIDDIAAKASVPTSQKQMLIKKITSIKVKHPKSQMAKAEAKVTWNPTATTTSGKIAEVQDAYASGKITYEIAFKHIDDLGLYNKAGIDEVLGYVKAATDDVIQTIHGPLTHDLAQSVYKKMKKDMPTATPAQLRHAAADYLKVPYDDYLKAWKKPTTAAQKAATTPASKLPPATDTTLTPSPVGKYANKDISPDELKEELAKAYGPGANKAYISTQYNDVLGDYTVQFPKSLIKTDAQAQAVVDQLKSLGLTVKKSSPFSHTYHISTGKAKVTSAKNAEQIKQTGTYTLPNGQKVLDHGSADQWTERWWRTLSYQEQAAWKRYTGSGYREMNGYLRKGTKISNTDKAHIGPLSQSMQVIEHEITVFRGSHYPPISHFKVGNLWQDKGFMSTAINPGSSWDGVKYVVTLPKGSRGMFIGKRSSVPHENEFLIDKGTQFRVTKVEGNTVYLTAIPRKVVTNG